MYIDYSKLWKLLIDKGMTKTDLMHQCGMSSRTLAKLSKNQNVTTDTLLQICTVLGCGIGEVMEICEGEQRLPFYEAFRKKATLLSEDQICVSYRLEHEGRVYIIKQTKEQAGRHTAVHCVAGAVIWEQNDPLGAGIAKDRHVITKKKFCERGQRGVVVISGAPATLAGLDMGGFLAAESTPAASDDVYVLTGAAFKHFAPA